jgi:predicted alpha/beta-fold hydrolase
LLPAIEHQIPMGENGYSLVFENRPSQPAAEHADEAVLLLHGLGSSHAGTYMTSMTQRLLEQGVRVFRADLPGAGPSGRFTPLPPHGACFEEIWNMLVHLRDKTGIRRWRASGVSLGGNILLKMLAVKHALIDTGDGSRQLSILRAVSVAPPIRLSDCSAHMEQGLHRLYANYFMGTLRKQAAQRATIWPQWAEQLKHASFETIRKFDETVTAPMAGFRDAEEYYAAGSSAAWLDQIQVPTVILIDQHDPIVPAWMFDSAALSPTTVLRKTEYGGHVGYLHRNLVSSPLTRLPVDRKSVHRWSDAWIVSELMANGA